MTVPLPVAMCLSVNDEDGKSTGYLLANQVRLAVTFIPQDLITLDAKGLLCIMQLLTTILTSTKQEKN
ncbi:hypothetical protein [Francisella salimarina]|uniref:hypothetical protein n=1 Tax=Francisella salimarina TaxID=2599927 RepID=UPI003D8179AA